MRLFSLWKAENANAPVRRTESVATGAESFGAVPFLRVSRCPEHDVAGEEDAHDERAKDEPDDEDDSYQTATTAIVITLAVTGRAAEEAAEMSKDAGEEVDGLGCVVVHRVGVVRDFRATQKGRAFEEIEPGVHRDRQPRTEDRDDERYIAEFQRGLEHVGGEEIDRRVRRRLRLDRDLGPDEPKADQDDPREPAGGHDRTHPVHEVGKPALLPTFVPSLPAGPGVEPRDGDVQDQDQDESGH